jgi:hypothetical protein
MLHDPVRSVNQEDPALSELPQTGRQKQSLLFAEIAIS